MKEVKNTISQQPIVVYLIAGEASGDLLGSRLMKSLITKTQGGVVFKGVGGETMQAAGFTSLFDNKELAIMGFAEVVPKIPKVFKLINQVVKDIMDTKPDIVITIDSWSFSDRIHRKLKNVSFPHIHYVAPQVWAWKQGRARKMGDKITALLTLFPFENKYFTKYGIDTTCVGHPVVESIVSDNNSPDFRSVHNITKDAIILCILAGSRHNEVNYLLPVFKETVELLKEKIPNLFIVMPTVASVQDKVISNTKNWSIKPLILTGETNKFAAFKNSQIALAASGTVSLELGLCGIPQVIAYKLSVITAYFAKKFIKLKYVNLINIMADKGIIPEFLQENCNPKALSDEVIRLLNNPNIRTEQITKTQEIMEKIGFNNNQSPSDLAADKIIEIVNISLAKGKN